MPEAFQKELNSIQSSCWPKYSTQSSLYHLHPKASSAHEYITRQETFYPSEMAEIVILKVRRPQPNKLVDLAYLHPQTSCPNS